MGQFHPISASNPHILRPSKETGKSDGSRPYHSESAREERGIWVHVAITASPRTLVESVTLDFLGESSIKAIHWESERTGAKVIRQTDFPIHDPPTHCDHHIRLMPQIESQKRFDERVGGVEGVGNQGLGVPTVPPQRVYKNEVLRDSLGLSPERAHPLWTLPLAKVS